MYRHRHDSIIQQFKWYYSNNVKIVIRKLPPGFKMHRLHIMRMMLNLFFDEHFEMKYKQAQADLPWTLTNIFLKRCLLLLFIPLFCCCCVCDSFFFMSFVFFVIIEMDHLLHIFILRIFFLYFSLCVLISWRFLFCYHFVCWWMHAIPLVPIIIIITGRKK